MRRRLTRLGSASSTSISKLPGPEMTSPRTGRRPTWVTRYPPSVSTSSPASPVTKSSPMTERTSSRLARASAMKELSACRTIAGGSSLSCSSSISPTICSTMSSIDTRPSVPPYSSTTSAKWMREACICAKRSIARIDGGTKSSLRMMFASISGSARSTARRSRPAGRGFFLLAVHVVGTQAFAVMNDAFRIVECFVLDHQPRMRRAFEQAHQLAKRNVALHRDDVGAMDHHVGDAPLMQAEDIAQHGALDRGKTDIVRRARVEYDLQVVADRSGLPSEQSADRAHQPVVGGGTQDLALL